MLVPMAFLSVLESMRHGEAAALRLNEIDLKPGIISISRSRDSGEDNCAQDCGFGSRDSDAPVGRRSLEATAGKASFGWFRIRFPDPGAEADDGQLVAEARSSSTACRRRIEGHLVQSSSQSSDSAAEVLHHPAHVYRVGTLGRRQLKRALRILRNLGPDGRTELWQIHPEGLPRTADRGASKSAASDWRKTGPLTGPPWAYREKGPNFLRTFGGGGEN